MDAADVFRQGLGAAFQQPQYFYPNRPPVPVLGAPTPQASAQWDNQENEAPHRIAHTLTACCRCRQRKTKCDPTLPRCIPCERSGSVCEYYDSAKGKKINRSYVVSLQKKVRQLEEELAKYTDEDGDYPRTHADIVRPGGMVRLNETDETPRYLGPSSGIAMTRLLMEEAKRFTESRRIADLIPEVRAKRERVVELRDRMQSVTMGGTSVSGPSGKYQSYPAHSDLPAQSLPNREVYDRLVRVFHERVQVFTPVLHEKELAKDVEAVYAGDTDPYRLFVVNMVAAISLQKVRKYAGLPDSYYLSAMKHFEDVVRPKDLKTLQCLVLIGQYSLLTPTRTAIYYIIGLATRICQQLGLGDEKTITMDNPDPQTLDMRRRLSWIVTTQELGLAHTMGRPNGFAKADDLMNVKFFEAVPDEDITPEGICHERTCERKMVAIYFCKMRLLQAEIRRMLYEKKRLEPAHESHPWFAQMEQKLKDWLDSCPENPVWCRPWFTGRYYSMLISLYRPSPQIPTPTSQAAEKCFEGARYIIDLTSRQIEQGAVDITWVFLLGIYAALNALLWSISYPEVRLKHTKDEVQALAQTALESITVCSDRWPGSSPAINLYTVITNACLQSYHVKEEETPSPSSNNRLDAPATVMDPVSPASDTPRATPQPQTQPSAPLFNRSPFGYVFNDGSDGMHSQYPFDAAATPFQAQPAFRSNSIFMSPASDSSGRRLSLLPPESVHPSEGSDPDQIDPLPPPSMTLSQQVPSLTTTSGSGTSIPTPPESLPPPSSHTKNISPSPSVSATPTPTIHPLQTPALNPISLPGPHPQSTLPPPSKTPVFTSPPVSQAHPSQQSSPAAVADWFTSQQPFVSPFVSGINNSSFWDNAPNPFTGLGLSGTEGISYNFGSGSGSRPPPGTSPNNAGNNNAQSWNLSSAPPAASGGPWTSGPPPNAHIDMGGFAGFGPGPGSANGIAGLGIAGMGGNSNPAGAPGGVGALGDYSFVTTRHGSLSQEQQMELMGVLETQGLSDIDSFLSMGMGLEGGAPAGGGVTWS